MRGAAPAAPLEAERQPAASVRAGASETARRGGRRSSALARAIGTLIGAKPGNSPPRCRKQSSAPRGTADDRELARVQQGTIGRTRQNTHRTINPPATGPRTSLRLSRARRGRFQGGKGYLLAGPSSIISQQQGLAGVRQDTGAKQTSRPPPGSKFLRFRWGGREVNRQASHGSAMAPYLPAGPGTPQPAGFREEGDDTATAAAVCAHDKTQGTKGETAAVSTTLPAAGLPAGQRRGGARRGWGRELHRRGSPWHRVGRLTPAMGIHASLALPPHPAPKPTEPPRCSTSAGFAPRSPRELCPKQSCLLSTQLGRKPRPGVQRPTLPSLPHSVPQFLPRTANDPTPF